MKCTCIKGKEFGLPSYMHEVNLNDIMGVSRWGGCS